MEDTLSRLNDQQREAVTTTEGPLLVLSGAGTGKTTVLVERVGYIFDKGLARDWEVLALTFTNKAANEMKWRLQNRTNPQRCEWAGTFHSICLRILRRDHAAIGLAKNFLIYGEDEQKAVLKRVINALGLDAKDYKPSDWVEKISFYKDTVLDESFDGYNNIFQKIYTAYNDEMSRLNAIDFGDILRMTVRLFGSNPQILDRYRRQFKYVLVDEYQDTNKIQNAFLRLINSGNICCVGDDDQSIYSWRGAEVKNILNFSRDYPDAKIIRLEENYRSTGHILNAANSLIKHNADRLGKNLYTSLGDGEKVKIINIAFELEARVIADAIIDSNKPLSEVAVLIRNGSLSLPFEKEFASRNMPYRLVGAMKFYDRSEVRDVIAYIRLLVFPFDDLSFERIISKPRRGFGDKALSDLQSFAKQQNTNLFSALRIFPMKPKQAEAANLFLSAFQLDWENMSTKSAAEVLLDVSGYMQMWEESKDIDKEERIKNIKALLEDIANFSTLVDFLEQAALMTADDNKEHNKDSISIMTMHAAKGLEFDTVFLPAWMEGIFPSDKSFYDSGEQLEEERRLAYVAITRAKRNCIILYSDYRPMFGDHYTERSRFIDEIDTRFVCFFGAENNTPKTLRQSSNSQSKTRVGQMYQDESRGMGVIIEEGDGYIIVAFKTGMVKINA